MLSTLATAASPAGERVTMSVSSLEWAITLGVTLAFCCSTSSSSPAGRTSRRSGSARSRWSVYVGLAVAFGVWVRYFHGTASTASSSSPVG